MNWNLFKRKCLGGRSHNRHVGPVVMAAFVSPDSRLGQPTWRCAHCGEEWLGLVSMCG